MRILVQTHSMEIGGSQFNAIELAAAVVAQGNEVIVFGPPGELANEVRRRGLEFVPAPPRRSAPSAATCRELIRLVRERGIDLVHAYEYNSLLDSMYGPGWLLGTPVLSTVLSMEVPFFLPPDTPMLVGTEELVEQERRTRSDVRLLEPPVDTQLNRPGIAPAVVAADGTARSVFEVAGVPTDEKLVVIVCRLASELKLEGILTAVRAMVRVREHVPTRLLIVGDGPERAEVERVIDECTGRDGPPAVAVGAYLDPRPFYDAADVVVGMGGSVLRGLAFGKPAVVQGERGFFEAVLPETLSHFTYHGWYGLGDGRPDPDRLAGLILDALTDQTHARGEWGRRLVLERYSLEVLATQLLAVYEELVARRNTMPTRAWQLTRNGALLSRLRVQRALKRLGQRP